MIRLIHFKNLDAFPGKILHFSSTRVGGVSSGEYESLNLGNYSDDRREHIEKNRQMLCDALNITLPQLVTVHQIHGINIKMVDTGIFSLNSSDRNQALDGYDALVCRQPDICIAVTTADCVPVLLFDPVTDVIAAIHSGWKGTLHNIVLQTVNMLSSTFHSSPKDVIAAIGPCIGAGVYEVGEELFACFQKKRFDVTHLFSPKGNGKYVFNLRQAVVNQLYEAGVMNCEASPLCTFSDDNLFFSARRQGIHSGRMLSGIMLKR